MIIYKLIDIDILFDTLPTSKYFSLEVDIYITLHNQERYDLFWVNSCIL